MNATKLNKCIGEAVALRRKEMMPKSWTQAYLAQRVGVEQSAISTAERKGTGSRNLFIDIAHVLGLQYSQLVQRGERLLKLQGKG